MAGFDMPTGRMPVDGPKPYKVEYPYGLPGDGLRTIAKDRNATCVAYHRGVPLEALSGVRSGNLMRYGPGDERWDGIVADMREHGYRGGDGQRIIVHVSDADCWVAEGNHRLAMAAEAGVAEVELEVRYLRNADESYHLIEFDPSDPGIRVISD